jgi:hypothetical protein
MRIALFFGLLFFGRAAFAQVELRGTVYDQSARFGLSSVSVMSTGGAGTATDSAGRYHIRVASTDSISFSYLGRPTRKFPVREIATGVPFDMALEVAIDSLPTVLVRERSYRLDSLENRREYQKVFDYAPNYLKTMKENRGRGLGVGLDLDLLLDGKANRRMLALQKRLEEEEQDKYVEHRFSRATVRRVTGLEPPKLDSFMRQYRPSYEFLQSIATDYEFYKYIQEWGQFFEENWKAVHKE